jgi:hypothetical protein
VVPLTSGYSVVYAHAADRWRKVGQLIGRFDRVDDVRTRLGANPPRALEPPRYHGIAIGNDQFVFAPCSSVEGDCTDSPTR